MIDFNVIDGNERIDFGIPGNGDVDMSLAEVPPHTHDARYYTKEEVDNLVNNAGFKIIEYGAVPNETISDWTKTLVHYVTDGGVDLYGRFISKYRGSVSFALINGLDAYSFNYAGGEWFMDVEQLANEGEIGNLEELYGSQQEQIAEIYDAKQDTIDDLSDIRNGAEKGASAVQPAVMSSAIAAHNVDGNAHQDIREIAAGRTKNYAFSAETNPVLDSEDDVIYLELTDTLTDIDGNVIAVSDFKIGDNAYLVELPVYDRWYAGNGELHRLETAKVEVQDVKFKGVTVVIEGIAHIPSTLASFDDDSTHRLVTDTEKSTWNGKSVVAMAQTGTSTTEAKYITVNGTEYKLAGGCTEIIWRTY